jgi:hypothetical protein
MEETIVSRNVLNPPFALFFAGVSTAFLLYALVRGGDNLWVPCVLEFVFFGFAIVFGTWRDAVLLDRRRGLVIHERNLLLARTRRQWYLAEVSRVLLQAAAGAGETNITVLGLYTSRGDEWLFDTARWLSTSFQMASRLARELGRSLEDRLGQRVWEPNGIPRSLAERRRRLHDG